MVIFIIFAVISIGYGMMIRSVASGSRFYLFWIMLGVFFLILAGGLRLKVHQMIPRWIYVIFGILILAGMAVFLFLAGKIGACFDSRCDTALDYIIVLGAQVREDGPSVVLKYRLDCAADYLEKNPETLCIVTGTKGPTEPVTEARGMADYLISAGIDESRIILEEKAWNTTENIGYSMEFIPSESVSIGIVTSNFHLYRALGIAKKRKLKNVSGLAAGSSPLFLPNNVTREVFGVLKDVYCGNMELW